MKKKLLFALIINLTTIAEADDTYRISSDESNNLLFPTALVQPEKTSQVKGLYFLSWEYNRSIGNGVSAGARLLAPIGVIGGGPKFKFTGVLGEKVHIGFHAEAGGFASLWKDSSRGFYFAGGPMVTFGDHDFAVTMGSSILGGGLERTLSRYDSDYEESQNDYGHVVVANVNLHKRVTRSIKALLDVTVPIVHQDGLVKDTTVLIAYGIRIGGETMSGDIGFVIPARKDATEMLRYMPLGIPMVSLNFNF